MTMLTITCKQINDVLVIVSHTNKMTILSVITNEMLVRFPFLLMYILAMFDHTVQLNASITMATYLVTNSLWIENCLI